MGMGMATATVKVKTLTVRPSLWTFRLHSNLDFANIENRVLVLCTDYCFHISNFLETLNDQ